MTQARTVLIIDDEPLVRDAYRAFLARHAEYVVVGEANTAARAISAYLTLRPDIALMDLRLPGGGVSAIEQIRAKDPAACLLVVTASSGRDDIMAALRAGAAGYLIKNCGGARLLEGMKDALIGQMPLAASARQVLATSVVGRTQAVDVTPRERELLGWLAHGLSNAQIAAHMFVSEGSIKQYLLRVGDKLGARSRTHILVEAIRRGLVDPATDSELAHR